MTNRNGRQASKFGPGRTKRHRAGYRPNRRFRFGLDESGGFDELSLAGGLVRLEMMNPITLWVKVGNQHTTISLRTGEAMPWDDYA